MCELRWQYPPLPGQELELFVREKIRRLPFSEELDLMLTAGFAQMVCLCQHVFSSAMGESSASQRDVQRCLTIFEFFWKLPHVGEEGESPNERLVRCMVLAVAIVYYFRIDDDAHYGQGAARICGATFRASLEAAAEVEQIGRASCRERV